MTKHTHFATAAVLMGALCVIGCNGESSSSSNGAGGGSSSSVVTSSSATSSSTTGSSTSGSGAGGGAGTGGGDAGTEDCSPITNIATEIQEAYLPENPPTPMGGTIVDGTYEMASREIYTGPGGMTGPTGLKLKETVQFENISPGKLRLKAVISINGGAEQHVNFLVTVTGVHFDAAPACNGTLSLSEDFDATPTELRAYVTMNGSTLRVIFKKK